LGIGYHILLNRYWSGRAEYIYTAYQSVNGLGSPKSNQMGFSLLYNLDA